MMRDQLEGIICNSPSVFFLWAQEHKGNWRFQLDPIRFQLKKKKLRALGTVVCNPEECLSKSPGDIFKRLFFLKCIKLRCGNRTVTNGKRDASISF